MMVYVMENPQKSEKLFKNFQETMIWSCLQKVMGEVYTNDLKAPVSAAAILGDFCFFAGKPAAELAAYKPKDCKKDFMIMIPPNEEWAALIEACYGEKAKKVTRYAIKKEPDIFLKKKCQEKLEEIVKGLSREYVMKPLDREVFLWCKEQEWCGDWVSQYEDYGEYEKKGLGVVILKMPEEWFTLPDEAQWDNSLLVTLAVFRANRLLDAHDIKGAAALIDRLFAANTAMVGLHRYLLACDRIFCALLQGDAAAAERLQTKRQIGRASCRERV